MFIIHVYIYTYFSPYVISYANRGSVCLSRTLDFSGDCTRGPSARTVCVVEEGLREGGGREDEGETRKTCGGRGTEVERWERHTPE